VTPDADRPWARQPSVLWRRVLDDVVLLPPGADEPFALAGGWELWDHLTQPRTAEELARALAASSGADPAAVRAQLGPLLDDLAARGAIRQVQ
jgi:hypothetical protein